MGAPDLRAAAAAVRTAVDRAAAAIQQVPFLGVERDVLGEDLVARGVRGALRVLRDHRTDGTPDADRVLTSRFLNRDGDILLRVGWPLLTDLLDPVEERVIGVDAASELRRAPVLVAGTAVQNLGLAGVAVELVLRPIVRPGGWRKAPQQQ